MNTYNPLREILAEEMTNFFNQHPAEDAWSGTITQLFRLFQCNPMNDGLLKRDDGKSLHAMLQGLAEEKLIPPASANGIWTIHRSVFHLEIKRTATDRKLVDALTERELLAIMSAIVFDTYSGPSTPERAVTTAKRILHEIDKPV